MARSVSTAPQASDSFFIETAIHEASFKYRTAADQPDTSHCHGCQYGGAVHIFNRPGERGTG
jgi:hypothetical protein